MQRRKLLAIAGGTLTTVIAGCIGTDGGSESTPESPPQIEVEFTVESGDLVVTHLEGDVLQVGQTVYVTVAGETATEITLESDVHAGGEIIRVEGAEGDYEEAQIVGLYLQRQDMSQELGTGEVKFSALGEPAPNTQVAFDYTATASPSLDINHDGGDTINSENTGKLKVSGDVSSIDWQIGTKGTDGMSTVSTTMDSASSSVTSGTEIAHYGGSLSSGDVVKLQWVSNGGGQSSTLGTFETP
jgi:hypothetical protein